MMKCEAMQDVICFFPTDCQIEFIYLFIYNLFIYCLAQLYPGFCPLEVAQLNHILIFNYQLIFVHILPLRLEMKEMKICLRFSTHLPLPTCNIPFIQQRAAHSFGFEPDLRSVCFSCFAEPKLFFRHI